MVVWCTENVPRQQQFHVATAMPVLQVHHFSGFSKMCYKKLFTHVKSPASTVSARELRIAQEKINNISLNRTMGKKNSTLLDL